MTESWIERLQQPLTVEMVRNEEAEYCLDILRPLAPKISIEQLPVTYGDLHVRQSALILRVPLKLPQDQAEIERYGRIFSFLCCVARKDADPYTDMPSITEEPKEIAMAYNPEGECIILLHSQFTTLNPSSQPRTKSEEFAELRKSDGIMRLANYLADNGVPFKGSADHISATIPR